MPRPTGVASCLPGSKPRRATRPGNLAGAPTREMRHRHVMQRKIIGEWGEPGKQKGTKGHLEVIVGVNWRWVSQLSGKLKDKWVIVGAVGRSHTENEEQVVNWAHKPRIPPVISKLQGFDICFANNLYSQWQGGKLLPQPGRWRPVWALWTVFSQTLNRQHTHEYTPSIGRGGFTPFCRLTAACDTFFFPLYLLPKFLSAQGWGWGLAPGCVFPLFTHWFLSSLKPQPLMQSSSNQRYDLGMALGNFHTSVIVGEGKDKEFCCTVVEILSMRMAYAGPWSEMALLDFRSVFTSASFCEVLTKVKNRSIGKLLWDCHGKTLSVAAEAERLVSTGDGALKKYQETWVWIWTLYWLFVGSRPVT